MSAAAARVASLSCALGCASACFGMLYPWWWPRSAGDDWLRGALAAFPAEVALLFASAFLGGGIRGDWIARTAATVTLLAGLAVIAFFAWKLQSQWFFHAFAFVWATRLWSAMADDVPHRRAARRAVAGLLLVLFVLAPVMMLEIPIPTGGLDHAVMSKACAEIFGLGKCESPGKASRLLFSMTVYYLVLGVLEAVGAFDPPARKG